MQFGTPTEALVAFTVTFPTAGPPVPVEEIATWLTEHGEPFDSDGNDTLALRALPVRILLRDGGATQAQVDVTCTVPLARLIEVLFGLSVRLGADVRLAGRGEVTRASLWLRLADEQDRLRLVEALDRADERGKREQLVKRLWALLASSSPGRDLRWDANNERIVELVEVGVDMSVEDAAWHLEGASPGDVVPVPIEGWAHVLAWRWLSESYPGLAEK